MKNPWLSMWLSGANAWSSAARGLVSAEVKRSQDAMMKEAARQMTEFWFPRTGSTGASTSRTGSRARSRKRG